MIICNLHKNRFNQTHGTWETMKWSICNTSCGSGVQHRKVVCNRMNEDGTKVTVDDSNCIQIDQPNKTKNCTSSAACPEWIVGPWSECSELCGDGIKNRSITCSSNSKNGTHQNQFCDNLPYRPSRYLNLKHYERRCIIF